MKTHYTSQKPLLLVLSIIAIAISSFSFKGGCQNETLMPLAMEKLKKFTMIQNFPFYMNRKKKKEEGLEIKKQVITLNRGVRYKFYAIRNTDFEGQPVVSIYNNERMEFLVGTTYNATLQKFYEVIEFECKTTGNYLLAFSIQGNKEGCGLGVFSSLVKD